MLEFLLSARPEVALIMRILRPDFTLFYNHLIKGQLCSERRGDTAQIYVTFDFWKKRTKEILRFFLRRCPTFASATI